MLSAIPRFPASRRLLFGLALAIVALSSSKAPAIILPIMSGGGTYVWKSGSSGNGNWSTSNNWTVSGGTSPLPIPDTNATVEILDGNQPSETVTYDYTGAPLTLNQLFIGDGTNMTSSTGTGTNTLSISSGTLSADIEDIGDGAGFNYGGGAILQTGGTNNALVQFNLGYQSSDTGQYTLQSGALNDSTAENIGDLGTGIFTQTGGTNITSGLNISALGTYNLSAGALTATSIELNGNSTSAGSFNLNPAASLSYGTFTQSGGSFNGTLNNSSIYNFHGGAFTGELNNHGTANLYGSYSPSIGIDNSGTVVLVSGGSIGGADYVTNEQSGLIEGFGTIGNTGDLNNMNLINANNTSSQPLTIQGPTSVQNTGTMESSAQGILFLTGLTATNSNGIISANGGTTTLTSSSINNQNGVVEAINGTLSAPSILHVNSSAIFGGAISTDTGNSAVILNGTLPELNGQTSGPLTLSGNIVPDTAFVIAGAITNNTNLSDASDPVTGLNPPAMTLKAGDGSTTSATLSGSGSLNMTRSGALITSYSSNDSLINNSTINGLVTISNLTVTNNGTINASSIALALQNDVNLTSPGTISASAGEDIAAAGVAFLNQTGGSNQITSGNLTVGDQAAANGTYNLIQPGTGGGSAMLSVAGSEIIGESGIGLFTQGGASSNTITSNFGLILGGFANSSGIYTLAENASLNSSGVEIVGGSGAGNFNQFGGNNVAQADLDVGSVFGGSGTYTLTGGVTRVNGSVYVGGSVGGAGGSGNVIINSAGVLTVGSTLEVYSGNTVNLGTGGTINAVTLNDNGTLTQTAGANNVTTTLSLGVNSTDSGTYSLLSGTLSAETENIGLSGVGTFSQAGGANTVSGNMVISSGSGPSGSSYTLSNSASLHVAGSVTLNAGGAFNNNSGAFSYSVFNQWGGTFNGSLINNTTYNYTSGTFTNGFVNSSTGTLIINGGAGTTQFSPGNGYYVADGNVDNYGTIILANGGSIACYRNELSGTISGDGEADMAQNLGLIDSNQSGQNLTVSFGQPNGNNYGTMEATGSGILTVGGFQVLNFGGIIQAVSGTAAAPSEVFVGTGSYVGQFVIVTGGFLGSVGNYSAVVLEPGSVLDGSYHGPVTLSGDIVPLAVGIPYDLPLYMTGTIDIDTNLTDAPDPVTGITPSALFIAKEPTNAGGSITLAGSGMVTMTQLGATIIGTNLNGTNYDTLTNNIIIQGMGTVETFLQLTNNGTIDANLNGQMLTLQDITALTNTSTLEATNGGILKLNSIPVTGNGTLSTSAGSMIQIGGCTVSAGLLTNAGTLQITNSNVTIGGNDADMGTIRLTNSTIRFFGTHTEAGNFITDPSTAEFGNWVIASGGTVTGSPGDTYIIDGNLTDNSQPSAISTAGVDLEFTGSAVHNLTTNKALSFADLTLDSGAILDAGATPDATETVSLNFDKINLSYTQETTTGIDSAFQGTTIPITYTPTDPANAYLLDATYTFPGGGSLTPGAIATGLIWNNNGATGTSDGKTWDIANNINWNNGAPAIYAESANVTFNDNNNGNYKVLLNETVNPGSVEVNSTGNYFISGTGSIGGTGSLSKAGTGTLTLSTANSYSGGTNVSAGLLLIEPTSSTTSALPAGALSISGSGKVQLSDNVTLGSQNSNLLGNPQNGPTNPTSNVNITSLSITDNGTLDIGNNHIIINYGSGADPIASIAAMIASGYASGTWNGTGIVSTLAQNNSASYGIGYADSADPGNPAGLASGQIEIMYTLLGDANLDGAVNGTDFAILASNFNKADQPGHSGWVEGDFNYDGSVNGADFAELASNFNKGASQAADLTALESFASANGLLADVPEPTTLALLSLGAMGLFRRRRVESDPK